MAFFDYKNAAVSVAPDGIGMIIQPPAPPMPSPPPAPAPIVTLQSQVQSEIDSLTRSQAALYAQIAGLQQQVNIVTAQIAVDQDLLARFTAALKATAP